MFPWEFLPELWSVLYWESFSAIPGTDSELIKETHPQISPRQPESGYLRIFPPSEMIPLKAGTQSGMRRLMKKGKVWK